MKNTLLIIGILVCSTSAFSKSEFERGYDEGKMSCKSTPAPAATPTAHAKTITNIYCECTPGLYEFAFLEKTVQYSDGTQVTNRIKEYQSWRKDCKGESATLST